MSSQNALESVNKSIEPTKTNSKIQFSFNEDKKIFHDLVAVKKENKADTSRQESKAGQNEKKEKIQIKDSNNQPKAPKSLKQPENNSVKAKPNENNISKLAKEREQEADDSQILSAEISKTEEVKDFDQGNITLDESVELLEEEINISLNLFEQLIAVPSNLSSNEIRIVSDETDQQEEALEINEEIITTSIDTHSLISAIPVNNEQIVSFAENTLFEEATSVNYQGEENKDISLGENEFNLSQVKMNSDEEALLARLSSRNLMTTFKASQPKSSTSSSDRVIKISEEDSEIAVSINDTDKNIDKSKLAVQNNINTIFADNSVIGQKIWANMKDSQRKNDIDLINEELLSAAEGENLLQEEEISAGLENNNSNSKFATEIAKFGGTIETDSNDKLIVSFKDNLTTKTGNTPLHRSDQISLSIKEAAINGKSNITINMYPKALGAIDIHIEFSTIGGKQVVESIKITAERRDTLDIIQKSEAELRKNLTEVTKSSEDTSLEFNLKHHDGSGGKGNYFKDSEERQNWMNKFEQQTNGDTVLNSNYSTSNDYLTEDAVNILA